MIINSWYSQQQKGEKVTRTKEKNNNKGRSGQREKSKKSKRQKMTKKDKTKTPNMTKKKTTKETKMTKKRTKTLQMAKKRTNKNKNKNHRQLDTQQNTKYSESTKYRVRCSVQDNLSTIPAKTMTVLASEGGKVDLKIPKRLWENACLNCRNSFPFLHLFCVSSILKKCTCFNSSRGQH